MRTSSSHQRRWGLQTGMRPLNSRGQHWSGLLGSQGNHSCPLKVPLTWEFGHISNALQLWGTGSLFLRGLLEVLSFEAYVRGPTAGWEAACGLKVSDLWGFSPAHSAGSHLPDSQTEIWLTVVINILRRGHEMWLRKDLKKKITFYSLSYTQAFPSGGWWVSFLPVGSWYKNMKLWITC